MIQEGYLLFSAADNFNTFHLTIESSCHVLLNYCIIKRAYPSQIIMISHISGDASQHFAMVDKVVLSLTSQLLPCLVCKYCFQCFEYSVQVKNSSAVQHTIGMDCFFLCSIYLIK